MWNILLFFALSVPALAGTHQFILKCQGETLSSAVSATFQVTQSEALGNKTYKIVIESSLGLSDLLTQLSALPDVLQAETNQETINAERESLMDVDGRAVYILDSSSAPFMDEAAIAEINGRAVYILDGGEDYAPIFAQYHVYLTGAHEAWPYATGQSIVVAVLDTGVDTDHELFTNNIVPGYDFIDNDIDPREIAEGLDSNGNGLLDEGFGHGTHVAGIIKTIAPNISIMPIKVIDSDGVGEMADIISGIDFAIANGARIINMSMSISEASANLLDAIDRAEQADVAVVTSAGNNDSDGLSYPATETKVYTVTSLGSNLLKSPFSNYATKVDASAPGELILSAHPNNRYVTRSGTSMAAPVLTGQMAILMEISPNLRHKLIFQQIKHSAFDIDWLNDTAYKNKLGRGVLDIEASVNQ